MARVSSPVPAKQFVTPLTTMYGSAAKRVEAMRTRAKRRAARSAPKGKPKKSALTRKAGSSSILRKTISQYAVTLEKCHPLRGSRQEGGSVLNYLR